jgi:hypothetical protein
MANNTAWDAEPMGAIEILDALGLHRRSGVIQVIAEGEAYAIHVLRGSVVCATSSHRTLRLGHLLLQRGAVKPVYLHDLLKGHRQVPRDRALGATLVRDGAVTLEDLAMGLEEQAIEVLVRVIGLNEATYLLHADESLPEGIEIVPLDSGRLCGAAMERYVGRASSRVIQRMLPPPDVPLYLTVRLALVSYQLSDAELLVAIQIDRAPVTLQQLGQTLPLEPQVLHRTIISLLERGYVVRGDAEIRRPR